MAGDQMADVDVFHKAACLAGGKRKDAISIPDRAKVEGDTPLLPDPGGDCVAVVEFWQFGAVGAIVLVSALGKVGVYRFVGVEGEPVDRDIDRLRAWCRGAEVA